jgi:hypothetical protein
MAIIKVKNIDLEAEIRKNNQVVRRLMFVNRLIEEKEKLNLSLLEMQNQLTFLEDVEIPELKIVPKEPVKPTPVHMQEPKKPKELFAPDISIDTLKYASIILALFGVPLIFIGLLKKDVLIGGIIFISFIGIIWIFKFFFNQIEKINFRRGSEYNSKLNKWKMNDSKNEDQKRNYEQLVSERNKVIKYNASVAKLRSSHEKKQIEISNNRTILIEKIDSAKEASGVLDDEIVKSIEIIENQCLQKFDPTIFVSSGNLKRFVDEIIDYDKNIRNELIEKILSLN